MNTRSVGAALFGGLVLALASTVAAEPLGSPHEDVPLPVNSVDSGTVEPLQASDRLAQDSHSPQGMDPFPTSLAQVAAGCGTGLAIGLLLTPCALVPYVGACFVGGVSCLFTPIAVATVETAVGDLLGQQRGSLLWPILAAYGGSIGGQFLALGLGLVGVVVAGGGLAGLAQLNPDPAVAGPAILAAYGGALALYLAGALIGSACFYIAPAAVYSFTAEDKKPGDTEFRFPGLLEPAHAGSTAPPGKAVLQVPSQELAMAY